MGECALAKSRKYPFRDQRTHRISSDRWNVRNGHNRKSRKRRTFVQGDDVQRKNLKAERSSSPERTERQMGTSQEAALLR